MSRPTDLAGATALLERCFAEPEFGRRYDAARLEVLGEGTFACVARLHDRDLGQDVAVKMFWRVTPGLRARMRAEVANAQRIRAATIVQTHSISFGREAAWLQMELVEGPNLEQELERRLKCGTPFTLKEAFHFARDAADALAQAHAVGVAHRDVKPSNYLAPFDRRPFLKLGDFGISKHRDAENLTASGEFPGTPAYAALEVFDGRAAGAASDVYSLGLVLFRILTNGRYAYELGTRPTPLEFLAAHRGSRPRRLRDFTPMLPRAVEQVVWDALAKDPTRRPDANVVRDVLDRCCRDESTPAAGPPRHHASRRSSPLLALGAALGLGIGLAGVVRGGRGDSGERAEPLPAVHAAVAASLASEPAGGSRSGPALGLAETGRMPAVAAGAARALPERRTSAPPPPILQAASPPRSAALEDRRSIEEDLRDVGPIASDEPSLPPVPTSPPFAPDEGAAAAPASRELRVSPTVMVGGTDGRLDSGSARMQVDVIPNHVMPGEPYVAEVRLANDGRRPLRIEALAVVDTLNGLRRGAPASPLSREVKPGAEAVVNRTTGRWPAEVQSWTLEVFVTAQDGRTLKGMVAWR